MQAYLPSFMFYLHLRDHMNYIQPSKHSTEFAGAITLIYIQLSLRTALSSELYNFVLNNTALSFPPSSLAIEYESMLVN
jgi:hypothetical protein